jgi:hypothetical protein
VSAKIIPFPRSDSDRRIDALCNAVAKPGPEPLIHFSHDRGSIRVHTPGVELYLSPGEFRALLADGAAVLDEAASFVPST